MKSVRNRLRKIQKKGLAKAMNMELFHMKEKKLKQLWISPAVALIRKKMERKKKKRFQAISPNQMDK